MIIKYSSCFCKWYKTKINKLKEKILITGVAGFIGFSLSKSLLPKKNILIVGIDNFDSYYSIKLKKKRVKYLQN